MESSIQQNQPEIQNIQDLDIQKDSSIVLCGARRTGQSTLLQNIIHHLLNTYDYSFVILFSDTASIEQTNSWDWFDQQHIHETEEIDSVLSKLFQYLIDQKKKQQDMPNGMIILDDIQLDKQYTQLIKLFSQGRHFNIVVICSVQYTSGILSPSIRSNIDMLFCSRMGINGLEKIYETINDYSIDKKTFYRLVDENYKDHQFVCYDNLNKELCVVQAQVMDLEKQK